MYRLGRLMHIVYFHTVMVDELLVLGAHAWLLP